MAFASPDRANSRCEVAPRRSARYWPCDARLRMLGRPGSHAVTLVTRLSAPSTGLSSAGFLPAGRFS